MSIRRSLVSNRGYPNFENSVKRKFNFAAFTLPAVACIECSGAVSLRAPQSQGVDQRLQVRHLKVRLGLRWRGSSGLYPVLSAPVIRPTRP
jgi:hypothetical protein